MPSARQLANVQPPPNPAGPGNARALVHGGSSTLVEPLAALIEREVWEANPHLDPARHGGVGGPVCRYAHSRARVALVYEWLKLRSDSVFSDAERGDTHAVYERLEKWERQCDAREAHLAIAPLTQAQLGLLTAKVYDLAAAMAEDAASERRELEAGGDA